MKYTVTQREQIKAVRRAIAREKRYVPRGQGDSVNQHLKFRQFAWYIEQIKAGKDMYQELQANGIR